MPNGQQGIFTGPNPIFKRPVSGPQLTDFYGGEMTVTCRWTYQVTTKLVKILGGAIAQLPAPPPCRGQPGFL